MVQWAAGFSEGLGGGGGRHLAQIVVVGFEREERHRSSSRRSCGGPTLANSYTSRTEEQRGFGSAKIFIFESLELKGEIRGGDSLSPSPSLGDCEIKPLLANPKLWF